MNRENKSAHLSVYFQGSRGFCHYKVLGIDHAVAVVGAVHYVKESGRSQSSPSRTHVENEIHSGKSTRANMAYQWRDLTRSRSVGEHAVKHGFLKISKYINAYWNGRFDGGPRGDLDPKSKQLGRTNGIYAIYVYIALYRTKREVRRDPI